MGADLSLAHAASSKEVGTDEERRGAEAGTPSSPLGQPLLRKPGGTTSLTQGGFVNLSPVLGFPAVLFIKFQGDPRMHLCVEVNT